MSSGNLDTPGLLSKCVHRAHFLKHHNGTMNFVRKTVIVILRPLLALGVGAILRNACNMHDASYTVHFLRKDVHYKLWHIINLYNMDW